MKLRNKKTGEIGNLLPYGGEDGKIWVWIDNISRPEYRYDTLAELNAEWEDATEEPDEWWYITRDGTVDSERRLEYSGYNAKQIGNYFETEEEAEKAVEKLKAWKRLKDKGFRFEGIKQDYTRFFSQQKPMRVGRKYLQFNKAEDEEWLKENWEDLDLLFSGEDD